MIITRAAQNKLIELWNGEALVVSIESGGCSGLRYKMSWAKATPENAVIIDKQFLYSIVTDKKSSLFLEDVTLDFSDGLDGKGFEFTNKKAKHTCGCGNSFSA